MPLVPRAPWARDLLLGAVLTLVAEAELLLLDPAEVDGPVAAHHALNLLVLPAVALRRRTPLGSIAVAAVGLVFTPLMGSAPTATPYLVLLFLLGSLGWHAGTRDGLLGTAAVLVLGVGLDAAANDFRFADLVVNTVIVTLAWAGAHLVRRATDRRVAAEVAADRAARAAVEEERGRIARDLHDSLAHALTLMTLQAGGARERVTEPLALEVLGSIETSGRQALDDMHRVLGLLGPASPDAPDLAHLPELVEGVRGSGLDVDLRVVADDLPPSVSTTVYRVVQEALTNVVRHSAAASARVESVAATGPCARW